MLQILTKNHYSGRFGYTPRWLILHGTAGGESAQAIAQYFISTEGTSNPVSSNYIVGQDGTVVMSVQEVDAAWGNGVLSDGHDPWWTLAVNPNLLTISIEHVKPDTANATALTSAQQAASFALIKDICTRNKIPMRPADATGGITGHYSIDPVSRARCPGAYPWDALWAFLGGTMNYTQLTINDVSGYIIDLGNGRWGRKDNPAITMFGDHLSYWRWNGGMFRYGLPLSNEIAVDATKYPGVTAQIYERGVNFYDPKYLVDHPPIDAAQPVKNVYPAHIDSGFVQQYFAAGNQQQIAQLLQALRTIKTTSDQALGL